MNVRGRTVRFRSALDGMRGEYPSYNNRRPAYSVFQMTTVSPERTDVEVLTATIEKYSDDVDICTLHPANPGDTEEFTAWISAQKGSFLSVHEFR